MRVTDFAEAFQITLWGDQYAGRTGNRLNKYSCNSCSAVCFAKPFKIVGHLNMAGRIAASASLLYAKNLYAFLETMVNKETGEVSINLDDELVKATLLTHGGAVVHPAFAPKEAPKEILVADDAAENKKGEA